jgi:hypothetical protein
MFSLSWKARWNFYFLHQEISWQLKLDLAKAVEASLSWSDKDIVKGLWSMYKTVCVSHIWLYPVIRPILAVDANSHILINSLFYQDNARLTVFYLAFKILAIPQRQMKKEERFWVILHFIEIYIFIFF